MSDRQQPGIWALALWSTTLTGQSTYATKNVYFNLFAGMSYTFCHLRENQSSQPFMILV